MKDKIHIVIVDDHSIFCNGLINIIENLDFIDVVGVASNGRDAISIANTMNPDVILMDIRMFDVDGIEATEIILKKNPNIKIIALSMYNDEDKILGMMNAGAKGFLPKNITLRQLGKEIKRVVNDSLGCSV